MPVRNQPVITGPDIDKLAGGLYAAEILAQTNTIKQLTGDNLSLRKQLKEAKKVQKQLRGALNHIETLLGHVAAGKETKARLLAENKRLKAQLLNHGITPLEEP